jgi:hypothetical protein
MSYVTKPELDRCCQGDEDPLWKHLHRTAPPSTLSAAATSCAF